MQCGPGGTIELPVAGVTTTVGRSGREPAGPGHIQVTSLQHPKSISVLHAKLQVHDEGCSLTPLSSNTFVNGTRCSANRTVQLVDGSTVRFGGPPPDVDVSAVDSYDAVFTFRPVERGRTGRTEPVAKRLRTRGECELFMLRSEMLRFVLLEPSAAWCWFDHGRHPTLIKYQPLHSAFVEAWVSDALNGRPLGDGQCDGQNVAVRRALRGEGGVAKRAEIIFLSAQQGTEEEKLWGNVAEWKTRIPRHV